ncbi:LysE family translocator [Plantactinospora sp. GCM10030261]|uniref:LysE family translocator n=1 Tax=Plantactinospora sp. GCM10030261 TaxID=3273420 RepID=UPI003608DF32
MTVTGWVSFIAATVILVALPGPNMLLITTQAAEHGGRAGLLSALGVETATLVHIAVAVLGGASLITASPAASTAVRLLGAGYLLYLGVQALSRLRQGTASNVDRPPPRLFRAFRHGMLVNLLNPKVTLFFVAFLPQFVPPDLSVAATRLHLIMLGAGFFVVALAMDLGYVLAGARLHLSRLSSKSGYSARWLDLIAGAVYLALGGWAAGSAYW